MGVQKSCVCVCVWCVWGGGVQSLSLVVVLSCSNGRPWHEMRRHPRPLPNITQFTFWLKYPLRQHLKEGHQLGVPEQDPFSSPPLTNAPHAPIASAPMHTPLPVISSLCRHPLPHHPAGTAQALEQLAWSRTAAGSRCPTSSYRPWSVCADFACSALEHSKSRPRPA